MKLGCAGTGTKLIIITKDQPWMKNPLVYHLALSPMLKGPNGDFSIKPTAF
jgi:hypothetical protein